MKIPMLAGRGLEILCAAVVLGLSASLYPKFSRLVDLCQANCGVLDGWVPSLGYCAFVGAWGLLDALVGVAAEFVAAIPFWVNSAVDSFAIVAFLAAGVVSRFPEGFFACEWALTGDVLCCRDSPSSSAGRVWTATTTAASAPSSKPTRPSASSASWPSRLCSCWAS